MRVFAGIALPGEVSDHVAGALEMVRLPGRSRNPWIPQMNWHITLAFYGNQPEGVLDELIGNLQTAAVATVPFEIALGGAGVFHRDVCWIGTTDPSGSLNPLAERVRGDYAIGDQHTKNRFHVTISRSGRKAELSSTMAALAIYRGPAWMVDHITLYESSLGEGAGGHPLYTPLAEVPLG
ncbi:MAG: RNA 2',3'-cyclic phosphodiesterase [Propionibacteriaceae bacterium]|jgi:2'-5' RNA ligase|nr:RNA 2',3'-cyclic phosphodiesterase [Propionibacteriaceae bacterium]